MDDDELGDGAQPHCPVCGTVLRSRRRGYWCGGCEIVVIGV